jgi:hypothetical protein
MGVLVEAREALEGELLSLRTVSLLCWATIVLLSHHRSQWLPQLGRSYQACLAKVDEKNALLSLFCLFFNFLG